MFRKDLNHEGKMLLKGTKHIITINLLGVRKNSNDQVLYVTFPDVNEDKDCAASSASEAIEEAAFGGRSFAIPVGKLTGPLEAHVRWANSNAEANGKNPSPVVLFVCKDFSPEDFSVVAKILNRCYIDEDDIKRSWDCLEYFGPFNCVSSCIFPFVLRCQILTKRMDLLPTPSTGEHTCRSCARFGHDFRAWKQEAKTRRGERPQTSPAQPT